MVSSVHPNADDLQHLRDRLTVAVGDRYIIGEVLGVGGTAVVFAAEEMRPQRAVALKVLRADAALRADVRERFLREAQTAARLNHPHIVPILAVHDADGLVVVAMRRIAGRSLAQRLLAQPRPPLPMVARVLEQVADALAYAHAAGVIHRDIKPDNVLLDEHTGHAIVTDFGIARVLDDAVRLTQTGMVMGTPAFMSPEQAMGDRPIDGRSDVYGLGVLGYLMLTGQLPFDAPSAAALLAKQVHETPRPVRTVAPTVPARLAIVVDRCLAKQPDARWDSALMLRDTLRHLQRDGSLTTDVHMAPPRAVRHAEPIDVAALVVLRRRLWRNALLAAVLLVINWLTIPDVPWAVLPAAMLLLVHARAIRLWRDRGVPWSVLLGGSDPEPSDAASHHPRLQRHVPLLVSRSAYGDVTQSAVEDHAMVHEVTARLAPTDRALVPDLLVTADALVDRTLTLAGALADLDRTLPDTTHPPSAEASDTVRDHWQQQERTRASLAAHRQTLREQLERATSALRTLRLDVLALRAQGMGGLPDPLSRATQAARAVSIDVARALDVAAEVRQI